MKKNMICTGMVPSPQKVLNLSSRQQNIAAREVKMLSNESLIIAMHSVKV
jgi:hypothetical protein